MSFDKFIFGKKGSAFTIDFSKIGSGLKKGELIQNDSEVLNSLFELVDENFDGILDRKEINALQEKLQNLDKNADGRVSKKELRSFSDSFGKDLDKKAQKQFVNFLRLLAERSSLRGISSVTDTEHNSEIINYEDGIIEERFDDGRSTLIKEQNGIKTTIERDANGNIVRERDENNAYCKTTTYRNGQKLEIVLNKETNTKQEFINGKLIKSENSNSVTRYNNEGSVSETNYGNTKIRVKKNSSGEIYNSILEEQDESGATKRTETNYDGKNYTQNIYLDGKNLAQTKFVDGKSYSAKYDGNGNTLINLQYGETVEDLAKKFGCSIKDIIEANKELSTFELGGKTYFCFKDKKLTHEFAGETKSMPMPAWATEIKIPKILQADSEALKNRMTIAEINEEMKNAKLKSQQTVETIQNTANQRERAYEAEKVAKDNKYQHDAKVSAATILALDFYKIADEFSGNNSLNKLLEFSKNKINQENIIYFLEAYAHPNVSKGDSSFIGTVLSEIGDPSLKKQILVHVFTQLLNLARNNGVAESTIKSVSLEINKALKEISATNTDPAKLENCLNTLHKLILAKQENVQNVSEDEAMQNVSQGFNEVNKAANSEFETAREKEGWIAVTGDWVCGLFGCTTIDEMRTKLGDNAEKAMQLAEAANKKDKETFKIIYKELFGIDFDPKVVAAYAIHQEKLNQVIALDSSINAIDEILYENNDIDYKGFIDLIKQKFGYDDATIEAIIKKFSDTHVMSASTQEDKKEILIEFLIETRREINTQMLNLSEGKSIKELQEESEKLSTAAYGTNNIGKMVADFNKNMVYTEMGSQIALEVTGTIILQFIPGLGQAAATTLATKLASLGYKGAKLTKYLTKLGAVLGTVNKIQQGTATTSKVFNTAGKILSGAVNTGVATAAVNLSDGKEVKTVLEKTLLNMSFAGAGVASNILAPKLMQAFGISKQIAIECAEEIINAAVAYGITSLQGDNYTCKDAFFDFITGILISRLSHIKTTSNADTSFDTSVKSAKETNNSVLNPNSANSMNIDYKCVSNQKVKVDTSSRIRIANKIDIDLKDLQAKFDLMKDGDFFIIGSSVIGPNDIQINNSSISKQHIKFEKINGEIYITDLSSNGGAIVNTTQPDYAAQWNPNIDNKYKGYKAVDFEKKCDEYYENLREANYSYADSVNKNIKQKDIMPDNYVIKTDDVVGIPKSGWFWRLPKKLKSMDNLNIKSRISLNVKADKNLLKELDRLMNTGVYVNKAGKKVKIDIPQGYYKTPQTLDDWTKRHDPITMYFEGDISQELQNAIAEITEKYARKSSNGKSLMNILEGKPWIAQETYVPKEKAEALYNEARMLNPELAEGIRNILGGNRYPDVWNCSTGGYAAAQKLVEEYKLTRG